MGEGKRERIETIAKDYARSPESKLVVSPDNRSRMEINQAIHAELRSKGIVGQEEHRTQVLVPRQDLTGASRMWAARYDAGDVPLYSRSSQETASPKASMPGRRALTLQQPAHGRAAGRHREKLQSTPTAGLPSLASRTETSHRIPAATHRSVPEHKLANRELGTVEGIGESRITLKMDSGRLVEIDRAKHPHLDHIYA